VKFLARLEAYRFAGRNADFSAGSWIATDPRLAGTDAEDAESAQFDAVTGGEGLFEAFENGINGRFSFRSRQACALNDVVHDILLDQCPCPLGKEILVTLLCGLQECPTGEMLLGVGSVVNLRVLQYHKQLRDSASAETMQAERKLSECLYKVIAGSGSRRSSME
jgi:hypothetical protein